MTGTGLDGAQALLLVLLMRVTSVCATPAATVIAALSWPGAIVATVKPSHEIVCVVFAERLPNFTLAVLLLWHAGITGAGVVVVVREGDVDESEPHATVIRARRTKRRRIVRSPDSSG
jgi:hypothetical protein